MSMIPPRCLGGAVASLAPSIFFLRPSPLLSTLKTLTLTLALPLFHHGHRCFLRRPFSISAQPTAALAAQEEQKVTAAKPQWRAAIDFKWIRDNKDAVAANIKNRNSTANLELVLELYEKFLNVQKEVERLRAERNIVANKMKGKLEPSIRQALVEEGKSLKEGLVALEEDLVQLTDKLQQEAQCIPNSMHPDVPIGGEESSVVRKTIGSPKEFNFEVKDHLRLGKELDLFDFDAAAEVSGSKFYYLKNEAVLLEMALINWAIADVSKRGFTPLITPEIVRSSVVEKCGFQPRGQNTQGLLFLNRGLYRVHQFSKVEMFVFCRPEDSNMYHEELISIEEDLFSSLGLHFKVLDMASDLKRVQLH
ncbi:Serine--tRNA ligase, chloroplastic/mitochondrial [Ananas comosus]|uniref:Serine--tRNA ligase, chloroplastic/mitochondrial n=1 Tax=Ananas comosus TaxID=4615 RepID=A0A199VXZ6_ANACO|nr:Serine--tRNA ligase, chloroplastic/mitochondrial [Ananas comosus]